MNDECTSFRDRLLESEQTNETYREKYEREVKEMIEKKLTTPRKWGWVVSTLAGLVLFVVFGAVTINLAFFTEEDLPILLPIAFAEGTLFALAWVILGIRILRKGHFNPQKDTPLGTHLMWVFLILMMMNFMAMAPMSIEKGKGFQGVLMVLNGLVFFVMGVAFVLSNKIEQAELKTRERLLEIELRLAEIKEEVGD